jgi:hypothetical protein
VLLVLVERGDTRASGLVRPKGHAGWQIERVRPGKRDGEEGDRTHQPRMMRSFCEDMVLTRTGI